MSCPHSQQHTPLICERRSGGEGCLGILAQTSFVIPLKYSDFCRECLWGHQPKCMKLIVLIYLRAVRINQLKVKNWVCKYVPVLAPAPAFRQRAESEKLWWFLWRGALGQSQLPPAPSTHLTQAVSCELEFSVAKWLSFSKVCWQNQKQIHPYLLFPAHYNIHVNVSVSRRNGGECQIQSRWALPVSHTCHDRVTTLSELVKS